MATFLEMPIETVREILVAARNSGDWHVPTVEEITIKHRNPKSVSGTLISSLHSQYHDKEFKFNINSNNVQISEPDDKFPLAQRYRVIYNFKKIVELVAPYCDADESK